MKRNSSLMKFEAENPLQSSGSLAGSILSGAERWVQAMTSRRIAISEKLQMLRHHSGEAWDDLKEGIDKAWDEICEATEKMASRFQDEQAHEDRGSRKAISIDDRRRQSETRKRGVSV